MADNFTFFMPLAKVDKERRLVSGYASTPAIDLDGECVSLDAVRKALPGYMQWRNIREMHTNSAVGVAKEANIDDKGLFLTARIVDDAAWQKVEEGVYKGFSIGGRKIAKSGNTITEIELIEVSVVDRPANPECKIEVTKSAGGAALFARLPKRDARDKAVDAMAKAVSALTKAGPPAAKDGFSLPAPAACAAHGKVNCAECAEVAKRDFDAKQREADAKNGAALSNGSFPIENEGDLKNAIQAYGRAKDKTAAKHHIVTRARALGATGTLPAKWQKKIARKDAKRAAKRAASVAKAAAAAAPPSTAMPAFLTLTPVDGVVEDAGGQVGRSHELDLGRSAEPQAPARGALPHFTKRERKIAKRMGVAASLAYCFDSIRDAQRALLSEAKREGGDRKDAALAEKLGTLAQGVAAVIGQKAEHEGIEALELSDADDQGFASLIDEGLAMSGKNAGGADVGNMILDLLKRASEPDPKARMKMARKGLKKANSMIDDCAKAVKAAHAMHKAAYLAKSATAKAAKKPADDGDADDFDHAGAMEKLQKAYGNLTTMKTLVKGAGAEIKKAASGVHVTEGNAFYNVPTGVEALTQDDLSRAGPGTKEQGGEPPLHSLEGVFPGKSAKASYSRDEVEAALRVAGAEAESAALRKVLENLPAGGSGAKRPVAFDLSKLGGGTSTDDSLLKGVKVADLDSQDENKRAAAVGTVLSNMIQGGHGKSVFDPGFHGTAGSGTTH